MDDKTMVSVSENNRVMSATQRCSDRHHALTYVAARVLVFSTAVVSGHRGIGTT